MKKKQTSYQDNEEIYNKDIKINMEYLSELEDIQKQFNIKKYVDPDLIIKTVSINGIDVELSTDGLCGIKKIIEFGENKEEIVSNYKLIRKNYLLWPAYAMSINQQRGYKNTFDDRIDYLMCDLQLFFQIINKKNTEYFAIIKKIQENCKLYRAYLNMFTFIWLKSFGTFDNFIKDNGYEKFVKEEIIEQDGKTSKCYKAIIWTKTDLPEFDNWTQVDLCEFDKEYYGELIKRLSP